MSSMNFSMKLAQKQEMRQIMTVQMIQSIEMLQLPIMQLQEHIQQELISNPVLEVQEDDENEPEHPVRDEAEIPERDDGDDATAAVTDMETNYTAVADYDRFWSEADGYRRRVSSDEDDKKLEAIKATAAPSRSLREELEQQIHLSSENSRMKQLAMLIVGNIDSDGYLRIPLDDCFIHIDEKGEEESVIQPPPTEQEKDEALFFVQSLEPAGIGARNIPECLVLQLRARQGDHKFEERLILEHFEDLAYNRLPKIAKELNTTIERIKDALDVIRTLNPKPGGEFGDVPHQYIVPDVVVEKVDGEFVVRVEKRGLPKLGLNREYTGVYRSLPKDAKEREYLKDKMQSARWLIDSIRQRHETLWKIANQIVDIQRDFLENGVTHLKPLMMQEVADRIGMHVSTVSRALTDKYMQTPQGLFAMKYFFTGGFDNANSDGESESNRAIMARIRKLIENEDKKKPLSDQDIVEQLKHDGIDIARRTVAKYREKMRIPSSRQRKDY